MKLTTTVKAILCLVLVSMACATENLSEFESTFESKSENNSESNDPDYEIPVIKRRNFPLNQVYNPRIDNLNDTSENNYKRYANRRLKGHVVSELTRDFTLKALGEWLTFMEHENLHEVSYESMIDNIGYIKTRAMVLQQFIHFKSNMVYKKLGLLDVKLKEKKIIASEIENVANHPSNVSSNAGNSLIFRRRLEEVIENVAVVQSNFITSWDWACVVLGLQNDFIKHYHDNYFNAKKVVKPGHDKQYYPAQDAYYSTNRNVNTEREWDTSSVMPDVPIRQHRKKKVQNLEPLEKVLPNAGEGGHTNSIIEEDRNPEKDLKDATSAKGLDPSENHSENTPKAKRTISKLMAVNRDGLDNSVAAPPHLVLPDMKRRRNHHIMNKMKRRRHFM